jgi:hypothetical protein
MIVLKMMSGEDLGDSHPSKGFSLVSVPEFANVGFFRAESGIPQVSVTTCDGEQETYSPAGNTYVMESGKTIATFAYMPPK